MVISLLNDLLSLNVYCGLLSKSPLIDMGTFERVNSGICQVDGHDDDYDDDDRPERKASLGRKGSWEFVKPDGPRDRPIKGVFVHGCTSRTLKRARGVDNRLFPSTLSNSKFYSSHYKNLVFRSQRASIQRASDTWINLDRQFSAK